MSTPTLEVYANQATATVTAGGTTSSTGDNSLTVTSSVPWPAASASTIPKTILRIIDPAASSEIMWVTAAAGGSSFTGQSWTVTRGAEGTTPVTHAANWTAQQLVSAATLGAVQQAAPASAAVTAANTTNEIVLATYTPLAADLTAGASFDVLAYGPYGKVGGGAVPTLQWALYWGGSGSPGGTFTSTGSALLARLLTGQNLIALLTTMAAGMSWDLAGEVTWLSATTAHGKINLFYNAAAALTTAATPGQSVNTASGSGQAQAGPVTISGSGPIILTAKWSVANAANTITAVAPLIRAA